MKNTQGGRISQCGPTEGGEDPGFKRDEGVHSAPLLWAAIFPGPAGTRVSTVCGEGGMAWWLSRMGGDSDCLGSTPGYTI